MIVDVVHCCRCNRDGVLGLVFDVEGTLKAAEVCVHCLRASVEPWLKPVDLPEGKPVYADFDLSHCVKPVVLGQKVDPCPRCGSTGHYDPDGCPGK